MCHIHAACLFGVSYFYVVTLIVFDRSNRARSFVICTLNQTLFEWLNGGGSNVARVRVKSREIEKPMDKEHFGQSVCGKITLKWILQEQKRRAWNPLM